MSSPSGCPSSMSTHDKNYFSGHKSSMLINPVTVNSHVSDFKQQFVNAVDEHRGGAGVSNYDEKYAPLSEEEFKIKILTIEEANSIDEDTSSLRGPIQLPQTQF